jgi:hypothetical protein
MSTRLFWGEKRIIAVLEVSNNSQVKQLFTERQVIPNTRAVDIQQKRLNM